MRVGSLFSGIGGLDLGLERAGMEIVWQVEREPFCQKVLKKHWPGVPCYGDIKEIDFTKLPPVDLICGGFPCQPVSCAGKRQGDQDERWLWPEFYRAVCEARPRWVLVENVPGLLSASNGRLFGGILGDLARSGYDAEWDLLPAAAFGAPHLRFRVFLVAYASFSGRQQDARSSHENEGQHEGRTTLPDHQFASDGQGNGSEIITDSISGLRQGRAGQPGWEKERGTAAGGHGEDVADTTGPRRRAGEPGESRPVRDQARGPESERRDFNVPDAQFYGLQGAIFQERGEGEAGLRRRLADSDWWESEPDVGRVAHGIPSRVDRLKALGNAVVPQVAEWIGKRIMEVAGIVGMVEKSHGDSQW